MTALAPLQIPAELIARVKSRQAVPFVGAGFSAAAGIAGWDELVTRLRSRVGDWLGREVTDDELETPRSMPIWRARRALEQSVHTMIGTQAIEAVNREMYASFEETERRRVPRDQQDWPTVALALLLDAAILTGDHDFFGCCPT
jgi:PIN domain